NFYGYETCQLLTAPVYFREDMGIEETADGVNFIVANTHDCKGSSGMKWQIQLNFTSVNFNVETWICGIVASEGAERSDVQSILQRALLE
ncbi:hypothetical protein STEG23_023877, partial [Scotinomys teguina]